MRSQVSAYLRGEINDNTPPPTSNIAKSILSLFGHITPYPLLLSFARLFPALLSPPSLGGFLRYGRPLFGLELVAAGRTTLQATAPSELAGQLAHLFGLSALLIGHAAILA